jgi:hypothetical protein
MLIQSIIFTLGLKVIFTDTPNLGVCGFYSSDYKTISLTLSDWCDSNETLYHELGHALFLGDKEVYDLISKYPAPKFYYSTYYPTDKLKLDERVADYFTMYLKYPDFPKKFPEINKLFNERMSLYK